MNSKSKSLSALLRFLSVGLLITLVWYIDYSTGYEIHVGAFYAVTVGVATWYLGLGFGVLAAVIDCGLVVWNDQATGARFSSSIVIYANSCSRLALFLFVAVSFSYFKRTIAAAQKRVKAFEGKLPICSCCNRVNGGDGFWMDFPTYLRKNSAVIPEFDTCPQCVKVQGKADKA